MVRRREQSPEFVDDVAGIVAERAGLVFDRPRRPVLEIGLNTCFLQSGCVRTAEYLDRLRSEPGLLDELLAEITVGETYFFRDSDQFALLRERVFPDLFARRRATGSGLRLWSAACASGEEPYSLAILLQQMGHLNGSYILGTDVSRPALARARAARYTNWSLRGVQDDVIGGYFATSGDRFALSPSIREAVDFRYLNLAEPVYPSMASGAYAMDLILCRNVLLYFAPERVADVGARLAATLAEGGWLLLGSADPLLTNVPELTVEVTSAGLAYRRSTKGARPQAVTLEAKVAPVPKAPSTMPPLAVLARGAEEKPRVKQGPSGPEDDPVRWLAAIKALVNEGALAQAEVMSCRAREQCPLSSELAVLHAFLSLDIDAPAAAAVTARRAVYLDHDSPMAQLALGTALLRLRDNVGARRAFRAAERLLAAIAPDAAVSGADDASAGQLSELARLQLAMLDREAAGERVLPEPLRPGL